jgi:phosphoglycolate phosphatase-like HAD superfamily hydrolase
MPFIGVLYGYGTREEMEKAGGSVFAADVPELKKLLFF